MQNYGRFANAEFDRLMDQARPHVDLRSARNLLHQAEAMAMDDVPSIPIYWYVSKDVVAPHVKGFVDNAKDIHRTRWLSVER